MTPELADWIAQAPSFGILALMWWDLRRTVRGHERRITRLEVKAGIGAESS